MFLIFTFRPSIYKTSSMRGLSLNFKKNILTTQKISKVSKIFLNVPIDLFFKILKNIL